MGHFASLQRQLIVIGEAAAHLSDKTRTAQPDIPWSSIIGLRNILAHEYGEVLNQRVWAVVTRRVPKKRETLMRCWAPLRIPRILEETPEAGVQTPPRP